MTSPDLLRVIGYDRAGADRRFERLLRQQAQRTMRLQPDGSNKGRQSTLLVLDPAHPERVIARTDRIWRRILSRPIASRVDRQIASGTFDRFEPSCCETSSRPRFSCRARQIGTRLGRPLDTSSSTARNARPASSVQQRLHHGLREPDSAADQRLIGIASASSSRCGYGEPAPQ